MIAGGDRSRSANAELLSVPPEAQDESLKPGTAAAEALEMSSNELGSVGVDREWDMMPAESFAARSTQRRNAVPVSSATALSRLKISAQDQWRTVRQSDQRKRTIYGVLCKISGARRADQINGE